MRNLVFLGLLFIGCSTKHQLIERDVASLRREKPVTIISELNRSLVFASGGDEVYLKVKIKDAEGSLIPVKLDEIKVLVDGIAKIKNSKIVNGNFESTLIPEIKSPDLRIAVLYKKQVGEILELKTTLKPLRAEIRRVGDVILSSTDRNGVNAGMDEKTGSTEDVTITNGQNAFLNPPYNPMVPKPLSSRNFVFSFDDQSSQGTDFRVSDSISTSTSEMYWSIFITFPRLHLPLARADKGDTVVTLSTGEDIRFSKSGEIIDGVIDEGPMDYTSSRQKLRFPDIKYKGKGIILRMNARADTAYIDYAGAATIDNEFGIKNANNVLIINGTTEQRCIRPKKDFWDSKVTYTKFKFPTDEQFDAYLQKNCGFSIPQMKEITIPAPVDPTAEVNRIWEDCVKTEEIASCLETELESISAPRLKARVNFELSLRFIADRKREAMNLDSLIQAEVLRIRNALMLDASLAQEQCLENSQKLVKPKLKYHNISPLIQSSLIKNCEEVKKEIQLIAGREIAALKPKILSDFAWAKVSTPEVTIQDCSKQVRSFILTSFKFSNSPEVYSAPILSLCKTIDSTPEYNEWIKTQSAGLTDKILAQVKEKVLSLAEEKVKECLVSFPVDSPLNKLRYKVQRESCLTDAWIGFETQAINQAKQDILVKKTQLSLDGFPERLAEDRRRLQLGFFRKYFQ